MTEEKNKLNEEEKTRKIESLRDTINSAEKTIQSAKAMLLQLEGKKKTGRRRKTETSEEGNIVQGTFDGQIMIGADGKQYPVPANYASKSKLVEGDMLKLTITPDGSFIYKQIGPTDRKNLIGIVGQDEEGNYYVIAEGKPYKILLASVTYFKMEPGDEVVIVVPRNIETSWAAVENVLRKSKEVNPDPVKIENNIVPEKSEEAEMPAESADASDEDAEDEEKKDDDSARENLLAEWQSDIEDIKKEIQKQESNN